MNENEMNEVMENENVTEVDQNECYDLCESEDSGNAKAVVIGAAAAAVVTAGIYGGYKLVGKAKAAWRRRKLRKQAEEEIAQAQAFDNYDAAVNEIHEQMEQTED